MIESYGCLGFDVKVHLKVKGPLSVLLKMHAISSVGLNGYALKINHDFLSYFDGKGQLPKVIKRSCCRHIGTLLLSYCTIGALLFPYI